MGLKLKQWKWFSFRFLGEGKQATSSKLKHIYTQTFIIEQNKKRERKTEKVAPPLERKVVNNQHSCIYYFFVSMKQAENAPHPPLKYTHTKTKNTQTKRNRHEKKYKS